MGVWVGVGVRVGVAVGTGVRLAVLVGEGVSVPVGVGVWVVKGSEARQASPESRLAAISRIDRNSLLAERIMAGLIVAPPAAQASLTTVTPSSALFFAAAGKGEHMRVALERLTDLALAFRCLCRG